MASRETPTAPSKVGPSIREKELRAEIKSLIVEHLKLPDVSPESIDDDAALVGGGLDLDSIDVLELVTGIEKRYGVRFEDPDLVQEVFASVSSIASHLAAHRGS